MNIIFPIGGKGSRFIHQGYQISKPLIPIFNKSLMRYLVERLDINPECDDVYVIFYNGVSDFMNGPLQITEIDLRNHIFYGLKWESKIVFSPISVITSGVLETLTHVLVKDATKPSIILDCDIFYGTNIIDIIRSNMRFYKNGLFYFQDDGEIPEYSYLAMDEKRQVIQIYEKQKCTELANAGIYIFENFNIVMDSLDICIQKSIHEGKEPYLSTLVSLLIRNGHTFVGIEIPNDQVFNLGTPERIAKFKNERVCLLCDLDGTLVLSDKAYFLTWCQILKEFHINLTDDLYRQNIQGQSDHVVKNRFSIPYSIEQLAKQKDSLFQNYEEQISIIEGVLSFLKMAFWKALPIIIVTNCNRDSAEFILHSKGIFPYIHGIVIGNECSHPKPYAAPYWNAIEKLLQTDPKNCIIFEDSRTGILSGLSCNVGLMVGVETIYSSDSLKQLGVDMTIPNFVDVLHKVIQKRQECTNNCTIFNILGDAIYNALKNRFPDFSVDVSNYKLKGGFISDVICFTIHERFDYVLKLENKSQNPVKEMAGLLDLYDTEYYFYTDIAPFLPISLSTSLGIIDDHDSVRGIVLENMFSKGHIIYNTLDNVPLHSIAEYLHVMTELHLTYWGLDLKKIFPRLRTPKEHAFSWGTYIKTNWNTFYDKWNFMMTDKIRTKCQYIVDYFDDIENYLCQGTRTLCHGDFKAPNIFYHLEKHSCTLIDWQYVHFGKGPQDLVFFLIESFDVNYMTMAFKDYMLSHYFLLIHQQHGDYDYDEFHRDIQMSSYYFPFFVAVWFGSMDQDHLLDKNFPFFFIQRLFHFYDLMD